MQISRNPRTGFIHSPEDVIPLYLNGCLSLALLREKQVASVLDGKELLLRLLAFQAPEGNFPAYLHEFPRCYDPFMGLKLGALWRQILEITSSAEIRQALEISLRRILEHVAKRRAEKPLPPLWEFRYQVLAGSESVVELSNQSGDEWWEYWVSLQFLEIPVCRFYNPALQALIPQFAAPWAQEGPEPAPHPIEWAVERRTLCDQPRKLLAHAVRQLQLEPCSDSVVLNKGDAVRMLWKGSSLHTLVMPFCGVESVARSTESGAVVDVTLAPLAEMTRDDLFEIALFTDASPETALRVNGVKATVFGVRDCVEIVTPTQTVQLRFEQISGDGEFCGHIFRANRPSQTLEGTYDWKVALRTLRRSGASQLRLTLELSTAMPMACMPLST